MESWLERVGDSIFMDHHNHSCGGSCGCSSHAVEKKADCCHSHEPLILSPQEEVFMQELAQWGYLPVSRYILSSSKEKEVRFEMLAPVYINDLNDDRETGKKNGTVLKGLAEKGQITLDYDQPLSDYDYTKYKEAALFTYFKDTVEEGKSRPNFLGDTAEIELGSIALTEAGKRIS